MTGSTSRPLFDEDPPAGIHSSFDPSAIDSPMHRNAATVRSPLCLLVLEIALSAFTTPANATVFGDGDPGNGVEDSRVALTSLTRRDAGWDTWDLASGTLYCDGRLRGSASMLKTSATGQETRGLVLLTAAHVLFDLDAARPFGSCQFHYMGLGRLPGYQQAVDLSLTIRGDFDPGQPRQGPGFGQGDWALLYVPGPVPTRLRTGSLAPRSYASLPATARRSFSFHLLGWNDQQKAVNISGACRVKESTPSDLGGGAWPGQLLDDCDSGQGASGGGLVAARAGERYVVGIRSGAHWHPAAYPARQFPGGPPPGSRWDASMNTNYSRAIDAEVLDALHRLLEDVRRTENR